MRMKTRIVSVSVFLLSVIFLPLVPNSGVPSQPVATSTSSPTSIMTATITPTSTVMVTSTVMNTATSTMTIMATATSTSTVTPTATNTPTATATSTATPNYYVKALSNYSVYPDGKGHYWFVGEVLNNTPNYIQNVQVGWTVCNQWGCSGSYMTPVYARFLLPPFEKTCFFSQIFYLASNEFVNVTSVSYESPTYNPVDLTLLNHQAVWSVAHTGLNVLVDFYNSGTYLSAGTGVIATFYDLSDKVIGCSVRRNESRLYAPGETGSILVGFVWPNPMYDVEYQLQLDGFGVLPTPIP